jgi:hypothetical protein
MAHFMLDISPIFLDLFRVHVLRPVFSFIYENIRTSKNKQEYYWHKYSIEMDNNIWGIRLVRPLTNNILS